MIGYEQHEQNGVNKIDMNQEVTNLKNEGSKAHQLNVDEIFRVINVFFQLKHKRVNSG